MRSLANRNEAASGGKGGIRTHGRLAPTAVFKTAALNHSATFPSIDNERLFAFRVSVETLLATTLLPNSLRRHV